MDKNGIENQTELQRETFLETGVVPVTVTEVIPVGSSLEALFSETPLVEDKQVNILESYMPEKNVPLLFAQDFFQRAGLLGKDTELTTTQIHLVRNQGLLQIVMRSKQGSRINLEYSPFGNIKNLYVVNSKVQRVEKLDCEEESTKVLIDEMVILCRSLFEAKKLLPTNAFNNPTERLFAFLLSYNRRELWEDGDLKKVRAYFTPARRDRISAILLEDLSIKDPQHMMDMIRQDVLAIQDSYVNGDEKPLPERESLIENEKGFFPDRTTIGGDASRRILQKERDRIHFEKLIESSLVEGGFIEETEDNNKKCNI